MRFLFLLSTFVALFGADGFDVTVTLSGSRSYSSDTLTVTQSTSTNGFARSENTLSSGKHVVEFVKISGFSPAFGLVPATADPTLGFPGQNSVVGSVGYAGWDGHIYGPGGLNIDTGYGITTQVVSMLADLDTGYVRFYRDGTPVAAAQPIPGWSAGTAYRFAVGVDAANVVTVETASLAYPAVATDNAATVGWSGGGGGGGGGEDPPVATLDTIQESLDIAVTCLRVIAWSITYLAGMQLFKLMRQSFDKRGVV